jgi:hypothetical protein
MKFIYYFIIFIFFGSIIGCEKNGFKTTDQQSTDGKTLVKIGLFHMTTVATPLVIVNNGQRLSSAISSPFPFPGGGYNTGGSSNGDYLALTPGSNKFELYTVVPGTLNFLSKFFETTQTLEAGKKYTLYTTDTLSNAVAVLAPDISNAPDTGFARVRFINLIPNAGSVDFYKGATMVKGNIAYKEFSDFFDIPFSTSEVYAIRSAGSPVTAPVIATYTLSALNTNQRILSFVSRGYVGGTALRLPNISVSVNQ